MKKITTLLLILFINQLCFGQENLDSLLIEAVKLNDSIKVVELIKKGAYVNYSDIRGFTPLHFTTQNKNGCKVAEILINNGAESNKKTLNNKYQDLWGEAPLHMACANQNGLELVKLLIKNNANIEIKNGSGSTPLFNASKNENGIDIVKQLIENGADVNIKNEWGGTALQYASKNKNGFDIVKQLIENGADITATTSEDSMYYNSGNTALHFACDNKNGLEIVNLLIEKGADINAQNSKGQTSLHLAIRSRNFEIARLLIEKRANINKLDKSGNSAISYACRYFRGIKIFEILINNGANVNSKVESSYTRYKGYTPLHYAVLSENIELVHLLIKNGAIINAKSSNASIYWPSQSPIHLAIQNRQSKILQLLIKNKANINIQDGLGNTPLHYAAKKDDLSKFLFLVRNKCYLNIQNGNKLTARQIAENSLSKKVNFFFNDSRFPELNIFHLYLIEEYDTLFKVLNIHSEEKLRLNYNGQSLLHESIKDDNKLVFYKLIENNEILELKNKLGQTPLLYSLIVGNSSFAKELFNAGANVNVIDYLGFTPYYLAKKKKLSDIIYLCEQKDASYINPKPILMIPSWSRINSNPISFSPMGNFFVTAGAKLFLRQINDGKIVKSFDNSSPNSIFHPIYSPCGNYLISTLYNEIVLRDIQTGYEIKRFNKRKELISSVAYSPCGDYFITGYLDGYIDLWDIKKKRKIHTFFWDECQVYSLAFSSNGNLFAAANEKGLVKIWDYKERKTIKELSGAIRWGENLFFSPDNRYLVSSGGGISIIDVQNGSYCNLKDISRKFLIAEETFGYCHWTKAFNLINDAGITNLNNGMCDSNIFNLFYPNKKLIATKCGYDGDLRIYDVLEKKLIKKYSPTIEAYFGVTSLQNPIIEKNNLLNGLLCKDKFKYIKLSYGLIDSSFIENKEEITTRFENIYSYDSSYFAYLHHGKLMVYNAINRKKIWDKPFDYHQKIIGFSVENEYLIISSHDGTIVFFDTETGEIKKDFVGHKGTVNKLKFNKDNSFFVTCSNDGTVKIWDFISGYVVTTFNDFKGRIIDISYSSDFSSVISLSENNMLSVWDITKRKKRFSVYFLDSLNIVTKSPIGLFDATTKAMRQMYYVTGLEVIELEQLKDRYYEPGLLKKILNGDSLRNVQGFNDVKLYPQIELEPVKNGQLKMKLRNQGGGIGRVVISINGKEIEQDARGGNIKEDAQEINLIKNIEDHPYLLSDTTNEIEVKAYNAEGWLISRGSRVLYKSKKKKTKVPELFIVSIGISDYEGEQIDLKYAAKDAQDIAKALQIGGERFLGNSKVHTYLLSSPLPKDTSNTGFYYAEPNNKEITKTFQTIAKKAKAEDLIVVYLSGHGINHGGHEGDFYYLTKDAFTANKHAYNQEAIRKHSALSSDSLTELIKLVPALKQVLIIDACASGRVVENLMAQKDIPSNVIRVLDKMKDRTGMHIITGSAADAVSYEAGKYGQGILTYSLIEGIRGAALKEGQFVDINKLFQYSKDKVPDLARGIGGIQEPQIFSPHGSQSFQIGQLWDVDKEKIELAKVKPVFIRSMFMSLVEKADVLDISQKVDELLIETSYKGKNSRLIFVDAKKYPEAFMLSGFYEQKNNEILLDLAIRQKEIKKDYSLKASSVDDLLKKIEAEVFKIASQ